MYAPGTDAPYVNSGARWRPQPHSSIDVRRFGLPKARCSRWIQSMQSTIAEVEGETELNTTDSAPWSRANAWRRSATVASASSQLMRCHPASAATFGLVRFTGCRRRSGCAVMSPAALPFTHSAFPVGCEGSRRSVNVPFATVARAPQRDTHRGQYVATSVAIGASVMSCSPRAVAPRAPVGLKPPPPRQTLTFASTAS